MATTLFNQWVIHSGPRIRLTATTDYYRDGAYMYYRINTYIHGLDYKAVVVRLVPRYGSVHRRTIYGHHEVKQNKLSDGRALAIRRRITELNVFPAMPTSRLY